MGKKKAPEPTAYALRKRERQRQLWKARNDALRTLRMENEDRYQTLIDEELVKAGYKPRDMEWSYRPAPGSEPKEAT
jgi:hypothetical protein